jgi:glycerol-3-phosphate dehydrogenase
MTPGSLQRNPSAAAEREYDLIVVGGGIYGVMLAFEASARGVSVLLLERDDFGSATSFNSLKTIHGGLRHLQRLNLRQHRLFVNERRWFLQQFPDLVQPLPVLMPLYNTGLRRPGVMRMALTIDRYLSVDRNRGLPADRSIPRGTIISASEVKRLYPDVETRGLGGGALWFDACMPDSHRLIIEVLRAASQADSVVLNYVSASDLITAGGRVAGVHAIDHVDGTDLEFRAPLVVNAAGPWSRDVVRAFDRDYPELFRFSIAWNVLFDREALSDHALAVAPSHAGGQVYFLHPWKGRLLIGTGHATRDALSKEPEPSEAELHTFLTDINDSVPGIGLKTDDILHVFSGFLPVKRERTTDLTSDSAVVDHGEAGGPTGLFSVAGNRFTASRYTAHRIVSRLFPGLAHHGAAGIPGDDTIGKRTAATGYAYDWWPEQLDPSMREALKRIVAQEAVVHLDDLILRRTTIGDNPARALALAHELSTLFEWDATRRLQELERINTHFRWISTACYSE